MAAMISPAMSNSSSRGPSPLRPGFSMAPSYHLDNLTTPAEHHPVLYAGKVAVITGAASGIGRATAFELAKLGLKVALADTNKEILSQVGKKIASAHGEAKVLVVPTDVSKLEEVTKLKDKVFETWGEVHFLLNNAGIADKATSFEGIETWHKVFDVNVFGMLNVQMTFVPMMMHQENQAIVVNTGSKQGITNPPGNTAYNASKAAVKSFTEGLAHELRETGRTNVSVHLFVPGWTWSGMTSGGKEDRIEDKPPGAWTSQETVLFMLDRVRSGDFYIICPDNETNRFKDQLRIMWAAGDIAEGRPALSRWHPDYKPLYEEFLRDGLNQLEA